MPLTFAYVLINIFYQKGQTPLYVCPKVQFVLPLLFSRRKVTSDKASWQGSVDHMKNTPGMLTKQATARLFYKYNDIHVTPCTI